MKRFIGLILFTTLFFTSCKNNTKTEISQESETSTQIEKEEWQYLFNGKDLSGWIVKINGFELGVNYNDTFFVEDSTIKVSYKNYDTFTNQYGHLFYKSPFTNYRLKLQYRFVGEQAPGGESWATKNSGIMLHCQAPETMGLNQGFPLSLEAQFLGGVNPDEPRPTGNLCTPATHVYINNELITEHCIPANSKTYYGEEWVDVEITINNGTYQHFINGQEVISYSNPVIGGQFLDSTPENIQAMDGEKLTGGYIALQSESHPIEFRNIKVLEL